MIEEFSFGNFRSFKDIQTLNMTAAKIKSKDSRLDEKNLIHISDQLNLLKSKAIYGANASGKSNVVKAFSAFVSVVKNSLKDDEILKKKIEPFLLSAGMEKEPSFFQLIFRYDGLKYRYGFEATDSGIVSEWLFATKKREIPYFIRENDRIIKFDRTNLSYLESLFPSLISGDNMQMLNETALFLSFIKSVFPKGPLTDIYNEITSIMIVKGLYSKGLYDFAHKHFQLDEVAEFSNSLLQESDTGIMEVQSMHLYDDIDNQRDTKRNVKDIKDRIIVSFKQKFDKNRKRSEDEEVFDFEYQESEGTKKIFMLSPLLYYALKYGRTLVVDEFDASLHPILTQKIIELFNSDTNKQAQLIFVTHNTHILAANVLRRDQIDFVEKDSYGVSHLYTLVQFKGGRNTDSFEKNYIQGKYGAVPFLGDYEDLVKAEIDA